MSDNLSIPPHELRWLYVDFNSYFASVEQQLDPRLRGKPVAVIPVETEATCAIAASYEAKAFGIRTGTPVWEARKLCPDLICVMGRHEHYVGYHHRLIEEIERHIPVTKVCSIDEMACALMKNEKTIARVTQIARDIKSGIAKNVGDQLTCSIGVASNKYLAKVATDLKKPDGFTILTPEDVPGRLLDLPLRDFPGIGRNMEMRLHRGGLFDTRTLYSYAPKHLRAIWGSLWGEKMWYLLRGYDIPDEETKRGSIGHSHVLGPENRPPDKAVQVARRLIMKAAARLRRMEYCAGIIMLSVRLENGPGLAIEGRCSQAADDSFTFLQVLEELWQALMPEMKGKRLKKVSVTLLDLKKPEDIQPDLFEAPPQEQKQQVKNEKVSHALDALNKKFGKDTVSIGMVPKQARGFTGTKVAFTRIPDMEEFAE